jgi:hypothetical protein
MPTADPRRWQPSHVSYCYFFQPLVCCLLLVYLCVTCRLSACKIHHPLPFVISTNHLDHFPFRHSYLLFSSALIIPYWLVTFVHVHAACTHLNSVYLYQPIVIGEAFRLFVILLLLALPCLNSLTRCVITCPIWLNDPRQQGLEVFMNLSQPRFSTQAAAILTSSGFFSPTDFISGDMNYMRS